MSTPARRSRRLRLDAETAKAAQSPAPVGGNLNLASSAGSARSEQPHSAVPSSHTGRKTQRGGRRAQTASHTIPPPAALLDDAMIVDPVGQATVVDKVRGKRKRAPSSVVAAAPDQEAPALAPTLKNGPSSARAAKKARGAQTPHTGTQAASVLSSPLPVKKAQSAAQVPPRKGVLKTIDVDHDSSSEDEPVHAAARREEKLNEDGEDNEEEEELEDSLGDGEEPEPHNEGKLDNLSAEAVSFSNPEPNIASPNCVHTRTAPSSPPLVSTPVNTPLLVQDKAKTVSKKTLRERKLAEELPTITPVEKARGEQVIQGPGSNSDSESPESMSWLPHTDISGALKAVSKNTWGVMLNDCGSEMKQVLRTSFEHGIVHIAMGDGTVFADAALTVEMVTPLGSQGIEQISLGALISAAESLGFHGDYDVAHRLEEGAEDQYVAPLRSYTAHRLRSYRSDLKKAANSAYPSAVKLSAMTPAELHRLLESNNFIYPTSGNGTPQYNRPFSGLGLADVLRALFFGRGSTYGVGSQNLHRFKSSLASAPEQREIPDAMLAMAATAIHSVVSDLINPAKAVKDDSDRGPEFSGSTLHGVYKGYMGILVNLRITAVETYHKLMHELCIAAAGANAAVDNHAAMTHNAILATVDWANIAAPDA